MTVSQFRAATMNKIHWLFSEYTTHQSFYTKVVFLPCNGSEVLGALELVFICTSLYTFDLTATRQAWRMRVRLFQAIIQRVCC